MTITEIIETYQQLGLGGILILLVLMIGRHLLKQNKNCYESHQQEVNIHKKEIKEMNSKLLKIVEENSKANTVLAKAIEHLYVRVQGREFDNSDD